MKNGPATATDLLSRIGEGHIQLDLQGRTLSARPHDVRRSLLHFIFMAATMTGPRRGPWDVLVNFIAGMTTSTYMVLGWALRYAFHDVAKEWRLTGAAS